MAELDVFEARFAAAYRRYLDEAPVEVDAAQVAHTVVAAPDRSRWAAWAGSLRPAPAFAWLVLVALLVAALAGALFVGSQREQRPPVVPSVVPQLPAVVLPDLPTFACPPGSTPDTPGPADQARPLGPAIMAFDLKAGKFVVFADTVNGDDTWTFDVCTNTWTQMHPDREPQFGIGFRLVYDAAADLTIGFASTDGLAEDANVWAYDLEVDTWTERGVARAAAGFAVIPQAVYDPMSGLVITWDRAGELWAYDAATDRWTQVLQANRPTIDSTRAALAYDASVDRVIAYTVGETWLLDLRTGAWSRSSAVTPVAQLPYGFSPVGPEIIYDEAAKRTVISGGGRMASYDATGDRWEILFDVPGWDLRTTLPGRPEQFPRWMGYDPVNGRLVAPGELLLDHDGMQVTAYDVLALDPLTREWTVLVEPKT